MFTIDAHLDLSMNAMEWNRDLRIPAAEINARERARGLTDKPDRGNAVVSFPDLRQGHIGLVVATQIARYVAPNNPLPGWASPEQAWSQTQAQLQWYRTMEEAGEIVQIVDLMINLLDERLKDRDISLDLTQPARELLAERGYDSSMGARPLRRTIQREIEDPLSEKMLFGEIPRGSNVLVDVAPGEDGLEFTFASTPKADVPDMPPVETAGTD